MTVVPIPEGVRQVIGVRLSRLRPECVRVLQLAAALGDPFSFDSRTASAGVDLAHLLDCLDEASASGFVLEHGSGGYSFNHALVRETLYTGLSAPRRALLHAQVAEKLEAFYDADPAAHSGELTHHFLLGGRREHMAKATGYALQAAERATAQAAFEEAVRYYQMGLEAQQKSDEHDDANRCEILLALARAVANVGSLKSWDDINLAAAEVVKAAGLSDLLARACLATAEFTPWPNRRLIPVIEDALMAADGDSMRRAKLLATLACQRAMCGLWDESAPTRDESLAMARRLGDVRTMAFVVHVTFRSDINRASWPGEWMRMAQELIQLGRERGDKDLQGMMQCDYLQGALVRGDIATVDAGITAHARIDDEMQVRGIIGHPFILRSMQALLSGRLSRVTEMEDERERFERRINHTWGEWAVVHFRLALRWEQGCLAALQPAYEAAVESDPTPLAQARLAFIWSELGEIMKARALLDRLSADRFATIVSDYERTIGLVLLSQVCAATGDTDHARVLYDLLLPGAGCAVTVATATVCLGSISRYLGLLATAMGRFDDAEQHFDDSNTLNMRLGARPLLAHTKVDSARLCLARRTRGDLQRARLLLEEASREFEELGMDYHASEARELLSTLPPRRSYPDGLSEREVEVLRLIAAGESNREVANDLVLSTRTVERHINYIYDKTGVHSRAQATSYAIRHGLV